MLSKCVFFVICLLIANGAMGQTGQLEIKAPWARATPGRAENGAAYLTIVSRPAHRRRTPHTARCRARPIKLPATSIRVTSFRPLGSDFASLCLSNK
jgi:hypothetical protein